MSRVGKKPIPIPQGVEIVVKGREVEVTGVKGSLRRTFHPTMEISIEDKQVFVRRPSDSKLHKSLHGVTRTQIANMVLGVVEGFQKVLEIEGVGYRAQKDEKGVNFQLGFSHLIKFSPPEGIELEVESPNKVVVKGINKDVVGEVAAKIRSFRKPNPYTGKGIRYAGEWIRRKAGKTGVGLK
ncbi:50S ribosomal protein L6 [candidate division TA06 bacterium]|nr:50S ribosomal protein L6 [candidate division TA06 bacterium]